MEPVGDARHQLSEFATVLPNRAPEQIIEFVKLVAKKR